MIWAYQGARMATSGTGLQGLWVELLTPLTEDLFIHHSKLSTHVQTLAAKGIQGVVMFSHVGEGDSFNAAERLDAIKQLMSHGVAGNDILLHVAFANLTDTVKLIRDAHELGLHGYILTPPPAGPEATDQGLFNFFDHIVQKVGPMGVKLYLASQVNAGPADLNPRVLSELLDKHAGVFQGLIDQSHNASHTMDWVRSFLPKIPVISNQDMNTHVLANLGIHASLSSYANLLPALMARMVLSNAAQKVSVAGNKIGTDDQRLEEFDHMIQGLPSVPALKYLTATHYRDADWLRVRPPLAALNAQTQEKLNKDFKKYIQSGEAR
jgi:4-hydroxy-tetrahydrodipicolinate synthase